MFTQTTLEVSLVPFTAYKRNKLVQHKSLIVFFRPPCMHQFATARMKLELIRSDVEINQVPPSAHQSSELLDMFSSMLNPSTQP